MDSKGRLQLEIKVPRSLAGREKKHAGIIVATIRKVTQRDKR